MAKTTKVTNMVVEEVEGRAVLVLLGKDSLRRDVRMSLPIEGLSEIFAQAALLADTHFKNQNPDLVAGWRRSQARHPEAFQLGATDDGKVLLNYRFSNGLGTDLSLDRSTALALAEEMKETAERLPPSSTAAH